MRSILSAWNRLSPRIERLFIAMKIREVFAWYCGLLAVSIGFRIYIVYSFGMFSETFAPAAPALLRGVFSDSLVSFLLACLLVNKFPVKLRWGFALFWCLVLSGNHNQILTNSTNINVFFPHDAFDRTFILGSALSRPLLLAGMLAFVFLACVVCYLQRWFARHFLPNIAVLEIVLLPALAMIVYQPEGQNWALYNVVEDNILSRIAAQREVDWTPIDKSLIAKYKYPDLSGTKFIKDVPTDVKQNVIVIVIESLSAQMMQDGWTPNLVKWREKGLYYSNFVSPSRKTISGIYSILCGDYAPFIMRYRDQDSAIRATQVIARDQPLYCLPHAFAKEGYKTSFVQAAPIKFENKDKMLKLAGFQHYIGDESFPRDGAQKNDWWGRLDPEFFALLEKHIAKLQQSPQPFLLMSLTVGTHDPYTVPENYLPGVPRKKAAFRYMDEALNGFLTKLESNGTLDNSVVLITGDESAAAFWYFRNNVKTVLSENHGFMLVLTPQHDKGLIREVFMLPDVFMSLADYAGLDTSKIAMGRSIFRHYATFRPIFWGSIWTFNVFGMLEPGKLIGCHQTVTRGCKQYKMDSDNIFSTRYTRIDLLPSQAFEFLSIVMGIQNDISAQVVRDTGK